jgi:NADH dehydrogenase FAD-containing subunit
VGAGRAHLHVLHELVRRPLPGVEAVLIADGDHYHAPMVPGFLQARYELDDLRVDVAALASRAGVRLVRVAADRIDVGGHVVVAGGERLSFDVCSLDVGCAAAEVPGAAQYAVALHPAARAVELRPRLDALLAAGRPLSVAVVGGGAAGVQAALAVAQRLRSSPGGGHVSLVERGTEVLSDFAPALRRLAVGALRQGDVSVALGGRATAVTASAVVLHNGASIPADLVVWTAGAAAPAIVTRSQLTSDERGYLLVDRSLREARGAPVWGAGGCVRIEGYPETARAGPYMVREAATLDRSLRAALGQGRPGRYRPQRASLTLLDTGGGRALMGWKGMYRHSRWARRLKDMLDRRFVRRYRRSDEMRRSAS